MATTGDCSINLLITGAFSSLNRGDAARVRCSIALIKEEIPNVRFSFLTPHPDTDKVIYTDIGLKMIDRDKYARPFEHSRLFGFAKVVELLLVILGAVLWRISSGFVKFFRVKEFLQYDMFVDLSGESLTDYYGYISLMRCLHPILVGLILRKAVVIYGQSIGPVRHTLGQFVLRAILNRVNMIVARDEYSICLVEKYKITSPEIYLSADPAFILKPVSIDRAKEIFHIEGIDLDDARRLQKPIIGVSLSRGAHKHAISGDPCLEERYQRFIQVAAGTFDFLSERMGAEIVFISHVIAPTQDDRTTANSIVALAKRGKQFKLVKGEYTAEELKGVIAQCDLFVSSRMHANIAALSSFVPTVAIAYSLKMMGLMDRIGLGEYVCDLENITTEQLTHKIVLAWQKREPIRSILAASIPEMQRLAQESARRVGDLARSLLPFDASCY